MPTVSRFDRAVNVLTLGVLGIVLVGLFRPGGMARQFLPTDTATLVQEEWDLLLAEGEIVGNPNENPQLVVFTDYECPYCRQLHDLLMEAIQDRPNLAILYRNYPLNIHPSAEVAARIAICADSIGGQNVSTTLFDHFREPSGASTSLDSLPFLVGPAMSIDGRVLNSCVSSESTRERLERDFSLVHRLNLTGTPAIVSKEGVISGVPDPETLNRILENI